MKDRILKDRLLKNRLLKDKLLKDRLQKDRLLKDRLLKDRLQKDRLLKDRILKDRLLKDILLKDILQKDRLLKDRLLKDRLLKDRLQKDRRLKDRLLNDRLLNDRLLKDRLHFCPGQADPACVSRGQLLPSRFAHRPISCSGCGGPVSASQLVLRARHHVFHVSCFSCVSCRRLLQPGERFALRDGLLFCPTHLPLSPAHAALPNGNTSLAPNQIRAVSGWRGDDTSGTAKSRARKRKDSVVSEDGSASLGPCKSC
ncbi:hypothetical protein ACOMHN_001900 [Nucella lapillus]